MLNRADPSAPPSALPHSSTVRTRLAMAHRVMANLTSEADRSAIAGYIAELERELMSSRPGVPQPQ